jgi:hypothetical protein
MYYLSFDQGGGQEPLLVELAAADIADEAGIVKAGVADKLQGTVVAAGESLQDALSFALRVNAQALLNAVAALPRAPSEVEVTFALKATGELGGFAVGKIGGEANYGVRLLWNSPAASSPPAREAGN